MIEIQPITPTYPVIKPERVTNDEDRPEKKRQEKKRNPDADPQQDSGPAQHIDEIV